MRIFRLKSLQSRLVSQVSNLILEVDQDLRTGHYGLHNVDIVLWNGNHQGSVALLIWNVDVGTERIEQHESIIIIVQSRQINSGLALFFRLQIQIGIDSQFANLWWQNIIVDLRHHVY